MNSGPIKECPTCGLANPASHAFCTGCGRSLAGVEAHKPPAAAGRSLPLATLLQRDAGYERRREPEVGGAGFAWVGIILTGASLFMLPHSTLGRPLWIGGILLTLIGFWRMRRNRQTMARAGLATTALALVALGVVGAEMLNLQHPSQWFAHQPAAVRPATPVPDSIAPTATVVPTPTPETTAGVSMFRGDAARTGAEIGPGPLTGVGLLWRVDTGGEIYSSAAVAGNTVYVGTKNGFLLALDPATGNERWRVDLGDYIVRSTPAVADGTVYVEAGFALYALDAVTGSKRWTFTTLYASDSSPTVVNGTVYVGTQEGYIYAVDTATGTERWHFEADNLVFSSPAVAGGTVYFGSVDGNLYAVDAASGEQLWRFQTGGEIYSTPTVVGGTIYVTSRSHFLYAVDAATGNEIWRFGVGGDASPAVAGDTVYLGGDDGGLYALDAKTAKVRWLFPTGSPIVSSPVVTATTVYVASGPTVYAVATATGKSRWLFATTQAIDASPAVAGGRLYIGSLDGFFYALAGPTASANGT